MFVSRLALVFAATLALSGPALAQSGSGRSDSSLRVGGAGIVTPTYEGSDSFTLRPVPLVEFTWRDFVFFDTRRGLGANLVTFGDPASTGTLRVGPVASWRFGRDESESDALRGLGDIDGTLDVGVFARYTRGPVDVGLTGKRSVSDSDLGGTVELSARYRVEPVGRTRISFGPTATWADSDYMQTYFGVRADRAAAARLAAYKPSAGLKDVGFGVQAIHPFSGNWALSAFGGYTRMVGDAADSPIVKDRGTADQFSVGLGLSYRFW